MARQSQKRVVEQPHDPFPKIIVKFRQDATLPYVDKVEEHIKRLDNGPMDDFTNRFSGITFNRLCPMAYSKGVEKLQGQLWNIEPQLEFPKLPEFHVIKCPQDVQPEALAAELSKWPSVEVAYVQGPPTRPPSSVNPENDPRFVNQFYLTGGEIGINAKYAWGKSGGDGTGLQFMDIEKGWVLNHQDLGNLQVDLVHGANFTEKGHGASVLGIVAAVDNQIGGIGIAPNLVSVKVASTYESDSDRSFNPAAAIRSALGVLDYGDVLLLEIQTWENNTFMPIEIEPAIFEEIRTCTLHGIVVIEAAGNGDASLNEYEDQSGKRRLDRDSSDFKDSGAIMVGASSSSAPHQRGGSTNFGNRVDCYSWGEQIDTAGGGELPDSYTPDFGGTSGASAIVAGSVILTQSLAAIHLGRRFSPAELRSIISDPLHGTTSQSPSDEIGVMPDMQKIVERVMGV